MKITTKTVHYVDHSDLQKAIEEHFGIQEYNIPCDAECGNNAALEVTVSGLPFDQYQQNSLDEWLTSGGQKQMWGPGIMMQKMAIDGVIPTGEYIISVCW